MTKLSLLPISVGPFSYIPAREVELEPEKVLCNNIVLPWEFNPYHVRLWVVGGICGPLGAAWAEHEQDALDTLVDAGLGESLLVPEEEVAQATDDDRQEWVHLGNAGEPADLTDVWLQVVRLDPAKDTQLLCQFAEARGEGSKTLDK